MKKDTLLLVEGLDPMPGKGFANFQILQDSLALCMSQKRPGLELPPGTYEITNEKAQLLYAQLLSGEIASVDYTRWNLEKNVLLPVTGLDGFILNGNGATLLFDGLIQPADCMDCRNLHIKNLCIDWKRPPYMTGTVASLQGNRMEVTPAPNEMPLGGEPVVSFQNIDPVTCQPIGTCIFTGISNMELAGTGTVAVHCDELEGMTPGDRIILRYLYSYASVLHFVNCSGIAIENVAICAGPGMGVIAHNCTDLTFTGYSVKPRDGRLMSTNADATHFISCQGAIRFEDCYFEAMGDDAANVHGFYLIIRERIDDFTVSAALDVTTQDFLPDIPSVGDCMEFVKTDTLLPYETGTIASVQQAHDSGQITLRFKESLPSSLHPGDALANTSKTARLEFLRCHVKNIRGRAVLIQTRSALVKDCLFENCTGQGVHLDTSDGWWESLGTRDIDIINNRFINCGYGTTKYCDAVGVVIETECETPAIGVHKNIRITGNEIQGKNTGVAVACAENVTVSGNTFTGCREEVTAHHTHGLQVFDNVFIPEDV